jgi:hypothetical protein
VNDIVIRKLALLSQLAVFKDVIPGYRIRPLTDKEKAEKVSQLVARTREWEQGLVQVYQSYLRSLEAELKGKYAFLRFSNCYTHSIDLQLRMNLPMSLYNASARWLSKQRISTTAKIYLRV